MDKKLKNYKIMLENQLKEVEEINHSISQQLREIKLDLEDKINFFMKVVKELNDEMINNKKIDDKKVSQYIVYSNFIKDLEKDIEALDSIRF